MTHEGLLLLGVLVAAFVVWLVVRRLVRGAAAPPVEESPRESEGPNPPLARITPTAPRADTRLASTGTSQPDAPTSLPAAESYFRLADLIVAARATGQYAEAMQLAKRAWPLIPGALRGELAGVHLQEIVAIDSVLDLLAAADDEAALAELLRVVKTDERLSALRRDAVEAAIEDLALSRRILDVVSRQPGVVQKDVDELLGVDAATVRERCYWMAKLGRVERKRKGSSYALFPTSAQPPDVAIGDDGLPIVRRICPGCGETISERRASCRACGYDIRKVWSIAEDDVDEEAAAYALEIVGESYRQEALEEICGGRDTESADIKITARLVLEDDNPHDDQAVKVVIEGRHVGYLSREDARRYRRMPDAPDAVPALIVGGWDRGERGQGHFGVRLNLSLEEPGQPRAAGA